ncbi:MAG: hypothetical protein ACI82F_004251 [Planctomycetota bacterium]|jgi:hypothetical protein
MTMRILLLLTPLLMGVSCSAPNQARDSNEHTTAQVSDEETHAVTLDITGMT